MTDLSAVLSAHCERFNRGVATSDYTEMLEHLDPDADLVFVGVPVGPFEGRDSIAEAYRRSPPDDEIVLLDSRALADDTVVGDYTWRSAPTVKAGELQLTLGGDSITRIVVTFT